MEGPSALWMLEGRRVANDPRTEPVACARFWLSPGQHIVGRATDQCDIDLLEDKSISRAHATLTVPPLGDVGLSLRPFLGLRDSSRYGTVVGDTRFLNREPIVDADATLHDGQLVKFGYSSPYKVIHVQTALALHPASGANNAEDVVDELAAVAAAAGMPSAMLGSQLSMKRCLEMGKGGLRLVSAAPQLAVDGSVLVALLHKVPIVGAAW
jgi:hypothetical protein